MTPSRRILQALTSRRDLPPGQKGIYYDELARLAGVKETRLSYHVARARRLCPHGLTIRAYREKWATVWHLVHDYNAIELQGDLFERQVA